MNHSPAKRAFLKACGSLQDFLKPKQQSRELLQLSFKLNPSAKDLLEAQGIPHTAVFRLLINGEVKSLQNNIHEGDSLVAYPVEFVPAERLDPIFSSPSTFLADVHLGKLAKTLRLLGINTQLPKEPENQHLIRQSNNQKQMILTRNVQLLKNSDTRYGYWVRSTNPDEQIHEVFRRFDLIPLIAPFSRCMECNGLLNEVPLQEIRHRVPPKVQQWQDVFFKCGSCSRIYWQGSHYKKLKQKVDDLIKKSS